MNMFNYSPKIKEVHNAFGVASDVLLAEAEDFLSTSKLPNEDKVTRLEKLGFRKSQEVAETKKVMDKRRNMTAAAKLIKDYQQRYPLNKFINDDQVREICDKYHLLLGEVRDFTGFVPEVKLQMIEEFKLRDEDYTIIDPQDEMASRSSSIGPIEREMYRMMQQDKLRAAMNQRASAFDMFRTLGQPTTSMDYLNQYAGQQQAVNMYSGDPYGAIYAHKREEPRRFKKELLICAPEKDFDMTGKVKDKHIIKNIPVPDPVVLQPVKGGYLIVCAWGDEASDPSVVNQINN